MYFWRLVFSDGHSLLWFDGVFKHDTKEGANEEAHIIEDTIGFEEYGRMKGVDLTRWKFDGVYIVHFRH